MLSLPTFINGDPLEILLKCSIAGGLWPKQGRIYGRNCTKKIKKFDFLMIELTDKKLRFIAWAFLGVGMFANITLPPVAHVYVNYVERAQDLHKAVYSTIGFFAEYPDLAKAYLLYNLHLTGCGVLSLLILRFSARTSAPSVVYCRYSGLMFAGVVLLLTTFVGYVGMFASRGSMSGLGVIFIPLVALILAFPASIIGWAWGRSRIRQESTGH